jgi:hypothetical protein
MGRRMNLEGNRPANSTRLAIQKESRSQFHLQECETIDQTSFRLSFSVDLFRLARFAGSSWQFPVHARLNSRRRLIRSSPFQPHHFPLFDPFSAALTESRRCPDSSHPCVDVFPFPQATSETAPSASGRLSSGKPSRRRSTPALRLGYMLDPSRPVPTRPLDPL